MIMMMKISYCYWRIHRHERIRRTEISGRRKRKIREAGKEDDNDDNDEGCRSRN